MYSTIAKSLLTLLGVALGCHVVVAQSHSSERLIDLTHPFNSETIYWPTEAGFKLERGKAGITDQGYYYVANRFECAEHGGTHIDAPRHFNEHGQTLDEIPVERLIGPAVCVDVSQKCLADPDYLVAVEDFKEWEKAYGKSLEGKIVLMRTGFGRYWPDRKKYLGTDEQGRGAVAKLHFPGLDPAAADWLINHRHVPLVGIDTASIDHGQTRTYPTHVRLFRDNVPALENVANLGQLPADGFTIAALPMKITGGSGGPCRIVAILDEKTD